MRECSRDAEKSIEMAIKSKASAFVLRSGINPRAVHAPSIWYTTSHRARHVHPTAVQIKNCRR
jgi:hypothetical protein